MNEAIPQEIKRPGRPKAEKKGKPAWKPASLNEFFNKEEGFRYRMVRKDQDNLAKKEAEGWEVVSKISNGAVEYQDPGRIDHGKPLTSVKEGKDWILQRIPEDIAQSRDEYINGENKRRIKGLTAHFKKEAAKVDANTHGEITISSRLGTETIS